MSARKHLARRWYSKGALILRCHCGEYKPVTGTARQQDDAHRAHRAAMGETVQPRKPSELERLRKRVAELEATPTSHTGIVSALAVIVKHGDMSDAVRQELRDLIDGEVAS